MGELTSAPIPPVGPSDHVRGEGPEAIVYLDLACPHCAALWAQAQQLPLRLCVRHFPVASRRPRAPALHAAVEAVALQGGEEAFWALWDGLLADQAHNDDPHLWRRVGELGLDLERFEADRRSKEVAERVEADFRAGIRAGVTGTPSVAISGALVAAEQGPIEALRALAGVGT